MTTERSTLHVLAVGCRPRGDSPAVRVTLAETEREALLALRAASVDVLLTTDESRGIPIWALIDKVRRVRPKLHWWLVAQCLSPPDEVLARSLGVKRILDVAPETSDVRLAFGLPTATPQLCGRPPPGVTAALETHADPR